MSQDSTQQAIDARNLCVGPTHRHLQYDDGTPFFYLGDTAWQLFHRLNREDADLYLSDRAKKGFTVIQAVVLGEMGALVEPNPYGHLPFTGGDPTHPNEPYFRHLDAVVAMAAKLGLIMGLLPTWGGHWKRVGRSQPPLFNSDNARGYGRFLGQRFRDQPVIWILGGDQGIESDGERATIEELAAGLDEGDGGAHLMTYHPRGPGLSSDYFHRADWLDFNMIQSSHGAHDHDNGLFVDHDYALAPPKPTVDGEPRYEGIPVGFYFSDVNRYDRFDDYDVRQAAYWSMLAGACGFTYGNNNVWPMWRPGNPPAIRSNVPWQEALDHPGAFQMGHLRRLFERYAWQSLVPDAGLILDGPQSGGGKIRAARASDGSFLMAYSPRGQRFTLNKSVLRARRIQEVWFDTRYGCAYHFHQTDSGGYQTYAPPTSGRGNDWLLVLEGIERG